jgi:hypothetical protein
MPVVTERIHTLQKALDEAMEQEPQGTRGHLGISGLGHPCDRKIWLNFRWALEEQIPGRILRLFARGHREEDAMVSLLSKIGVKMRDTGDRQRKVNLGKHVGGSPDGIAEMGVPGGGGQPHLLEFKTANKQSFNQVDKHGVEAAQPMHYVQMQCYMHATGMDRAWYIMVCKDDDRIHDERIKYDKQVAEKFVARGQGIAMMDRMPEPISRDPSWYQCKMCPYAPLCHAEDKDHIPSTLSVNVRTCAHATPREDGTWHHEYWGSIIPLEHQNTDAGGAHVFHPDLVPESWRMLDPLDEWTAVWDTPWGNIANGVKREGVYSSKEIKANPEACARGDQNIEDIRREFGGEITG